ncbi:hypothetical protein [Aliamphritea spongicola]|uniref:hypothetical protein n=1 Tax=Aliamphritea spongicola TaxID=707589 RepID=UPI00196AA726|nr:hypothetical protein [Aliamphritea spongicola]MBN3562222.1 hypothetical protein [Aliamphritea spongicola]
MFKAILCTAILTLGLSLNAQAFDANDPRIQEITDAMTEQLSLSDAQADQIHQLNQQSFSQLSDLKAQGIDNRRQQFKALREIGEQRKSELKTILDDEQYQTYEATAKERRAKFKEYLQEKKAQQN